MLPVAAGVLVAATGYYSAVPTAAFHPAVFTWIPLQAFLLSLVAGVFMVPGAVAGLIRPGGGARSAFALVTAVTAVLVIAQTSVVAADSGYFKERYLFFLLPLVPLAFGVYLERGKPHRFVVFGLAAAIVIAAARLPISGYTGGIGQYDPQSLIAAAWLQARTTAATGSALIAIGATAAALGAVLLAYRGGGRVAVLFAIVLAVGISAAAIQVDHKTTSGTRGLLPPDKSWIDHSSRGGVTALATPISSQTQLELQLYWNPSVNRELLLPNAVGSDAYATDPLRIGPTGELRGVPGDFLFDYGGSTASFSNASLVARHSVFGLYRPHGGAPRFRTLIEGYLPDHWLITKGRIRAWKRPSSPHAERAAMSFTLSLPKTRQKPAQIILRDRPFTIRPGESIRVVCRSRLNPLEVSYASPNVVFDSAAEAALGQADAHHRSGRDADGCVAAQGDRLRAGRRRALEPAEELEPAQRHARDAALLARCRELRQQELLDGHPDELRTGERPARTRPAVEGALEHPRGTMQRCNGGVEGRRVGSEGRGATGQQVGDRAAREPRGDEALVHTVARDRVDETCRVAHEQRAIRHDPRRRPAQRQPVAPNVGELVRGETVRLTDAPEVLAETWSLLLPRADSDVDVVTLREHPPVTAGDVGELDHRAPRIALAFNSAIRDISFESDTADDVVAELERTRADAVGAVCADHHARLDRLPADPGLVPQIDANALAHGDAGLAGRVEQEGVEPPSLCHPDHRGLRVPLDGGAVAEPQLDEIDLLLDDRRRVDRALQEGARGQSPTTWLVSGEGRTVGEQHRHSRSGEVVRGGRAGGAASDDENIEALHDLEATMRRARGGVPERPKGTGCKPVGSAYGGSNPPAPIKPSSALGGRRGRNLGIGV